MGYFSSGTEGMDYQAKYCERCLNYGENEYCECSVWDLHLFWSAKSCSDETGTMRDALNHFIPMTENGVWNEKCRMFRELRPATTGGEGGE